MTSSGGVALAPAVQVFSDALEMRYVDDVQRAMYRYIDAHGLPPRARWAWTHDPFDALRDSPPVRALAQRLHFMLDPDDAALVLPHQLVWHLPDDAPPDYELSPHVDVPPAGLAYRMIVGVAFSPWTATNGTVHVWPPRFPDAVPLELAAGELFVMRPDVLHSPGINRSAAPRVGAYFRWAAAA